MRTLSILLLAALAAAACHGGTSPTAPSLPGAREDAPTMPGAPLPTGVTFTVRAVGPATDTATEP